MAQVTVDVDPSNLSDNELLNELCYRLECGRIADMHGGINTRLTLELLKRLNCPTEVLKPLDEWLRQPIATPQKLREWNQMCGVTK